MSDHQHHVDRMQRASNGQFAGIKRASGDPLDTTTFGPEQYEAVVRLAKETGRDVVFCIDKMHRPVPTFSIILNRDNSDQEVVKTWNLHINVKKTSDRALVWRKIEPIIRSFNKSFGSLYALDSDLWRYINDCDECDVDPDGINECSCDRQRHHTTQWVEEDDCYYAVVEFSHEAYARCYSSHWFRLKR